MDLIAIVDFLVILDIELTKFFFQNTDPFHNRDESDAAYKRSHDSDENGGVQGIQSSEKMLKSS